MEKRSEEEVTFAIELAYKCESIMPITLDAIEFAKEYKISDAYREKIMRMIAEKIPLDATAQEREEFFRIIMKVSQGETLHDPDNDNTQSIEGKTDILKIAMFIDHYSHNRIDKANKIIEDFTNRNVLVNEMAFLTDSIHEEYLNREEGEK